MKNILLVVIVVVGYFWGSISYAADPCSDDPSCIKAENAHFDSPNHYVFVAAYPGDELLIRTRKFFEIFECRCVAL